jgi:hypothetical protein
MRRIPATVAVAFAPELASRQEYVDTLLKINDNDSHSAVTLKLIVLI